MLDITIIVFNPVWGNFPVAVVLSLLLEGLLVGFSILLVVSFLSPDASGFLVGSSDNSHVKFLSPYLVKFLMLYFSLTLAWYNPMSSTGYHVPSAFSTVKYA